MAITENEVLNLLGKYIESPAPDDAPVDEVGSEKMISMFDVKPFLYMGFVWVHSGSFRKWIGQTSGQWLSQKQLATIFKKHGWVAEQGIKTIRINLWAIPLIKEVRDAKRSKSA